MKRFIFLFMLCILSGGIYGQNTGRYSALLLNLHGEGTIKRNTQSFTMQMPQSYKPGDDILLKKGEALIMLFSGEEIQLKENARYRIPETALAQANEVQRLSENIYSDYGLLAQSGAAYSIRGEALVFPLNTKLLDAQHAILRILMEANDSIRPVIKFVDSQTQKTVYEQAFLPDSLIYLKDVPFRDAGNYYWTINGLPNGKPCLGTIIVPDQSERSQLKTFSILETNLDYIAAISYYFDNNYLFDALALTEQAINKFPDVGIYKIFLENLKKE